MKSNRPWMRILAFSLCIAMLSGDTVVAAAELPAANVCGTEMVLETSENTEITENVQVPESTGTQNNSETPESMETQKNSETPESTEIQKNSETPESTETQKTSETPEGTETQKTSETTESNTSALEPRTRFDYKSALVNVIVTLNDEKDLPENAELVVTPLEVTEEMQNTISKTAEETGVCADSVTAFDISFMADGIEVEPGATVKVQITLPEVAAGDQAAVYHYDEVAAVAEDMQAEVAEDGTVAFDTTHFSTYVIVNEGRESITVTIQHIDSATGKKIYADDVRQLTAGARINDYKKANNWSVKKVTSVETEGEKVLANTDSIQVYSDTTIKVYYEGTTSILEGETTFFDYLVKPAQSGWFDSDGNYSSEWKWGYDWKTVEKPESSFNTAANYPKNDSENPVNRLTSGTIGQNYSANQYDALITVNGKQKNANHYVGGNEGLVTGLVSGLTEDMTDVAFTIDEPGFFSLDEKIGKTILDGYTLQFKRTGDNYILSTVKDENQKTVANAGNAFFPLDAAASNVTDNAYGNGHNYYFGMRYDIMFTLGDYVGPLNYSFTGDDDLWVILDGKQVVIDLGGIHDALSAEVNLWDALGLKEGIGATTEAERNQQHRLTILYMERGGNASNCQMNFTIPSAEIVSVTSTTTNLTLYKVNSSDEPLAGARFKLVNDANGSETTATSQADGTVTFRNLKVGTYTLSETMAPDGYTASLETWKIKVWEEAGEIIAKAYLADGIEELKDNKIVNKTTQEYLTDAVEYDKTAVLADWDDRTYDITLSASSKVAYTTGGDTTATVTKPSVDVVLVLDVSGSMNRGTCLSDLKTAASNFVDGLYNNADAKSQVAIVTFGVNAATVQNLTTLTEDNIEDVKTKIDQITASGGTDQSKGLEMASQILGKSTNDNKYVILFTDGKPDTNGENKTSDETPIATAAYSYATNIKKSATIYTVRLGDIAGGSVSYCVTGTHYENKKKVTDYKYTNRTYVEWLGDLATDAQHALSVSSSSQLKSIFGQIKNEVTTPAETVYVPLSGVTVADTIDSRFELTDGEKERLMADGANVVSNTDGTTTILWSNQTINKKTDDGTPGFCKVIHVKAKEDYIGGNAVTTNVNPGSYIESDGERMEFTQPTVNVKVKFDVANHLEEIFLGENVPTDADILQNLIDVESLAAAYNLDTDSFVLSWYEDKELTSEISVSDMAKVKPDIDGAEYYLKVTYDAGAPTEESNRNTQVDGQAKYNGTPEDDYMVEAVNTEDSSLNYGIYTINVVEGRIIITKTIPQGSYKKHQGDPIFTFKITNTDNNEVYYRTVRFKDAETTTITTSVSNLKKGHYLVEELDTIRYDMTGLLVNTGTTSCAYKAGSTSASFAIGYTAAEDAGTGYVTSGEKVNGQVGSITFTNAKEDESRELTDTDVVKNTFAVGGNTSATKDADNNR